MTGRPEAGGVPPRTRLASAVERLDARVGARLEAALRDSHRRTLSRAGRLSALDAEAPWAGGAPQPRAGNSVALLVDGADAFPAMARAVARARSHVHWSAMSVDAGFALVREPGAESTRLSDLLARTAQRAQVRVLLWEGLGLPVGTPWRGGARLTLERLCRGTGVRGALSGTGIPGGFCHEKILVVDDEVAFIGSLEPTDAYGDRWDSSRHRPRDPVAWHGVTAEVRGPVVGDIAAHFAARWQQATGEAVSPPKVASPAGDATAQLVTTIPAPARDGAAKGSFSALEAQLGVLGAARRLIYIETQMLWSVEVVDLLAEKLRRPPSDEFRIVVVLPVAPQRGIDATRGHLHRLHEADAGRGRLVACTLWARDDGHVTPIYLHAKLAVVDDEWLTVGSVNLSDQSLFNDTEAQLLVHDPQQARGLRERLWGEHLERPLDAVRGVPATELVDRRWRPVADEQLGRRAAGRRPTARISSLAAAPSATARTAGALQSLVIGSRVGGSLRRPS